MKFFAWICVSFFIICAIIRYLRLIPKFDGFWEKIFVNKVHRLEDKFPTLMTVIYFTFILLGGLSFIIVLFF